jgi:peptidoglycan/LPS O-acetylase OafA/YrhL
VTWLRRCLVLSAAALFAAIVLLVAGVPGSALLGFLPLAACLGTHALMGHGGHHRTPPQGVDRPGHEQPRWTLRSH